MAASDIDVLSAIVIGFSLYVFFILISHASIGKQAQNAPCKVDIYTSVTPR